MQISKYKVNPTPNSKFASDRYRESQSLYDDYKKDTIHVDFTEYEEPASEPELDKNDNFTDTVFVFGIVLALITGFILGGL